MHIVYLLIIKHFHVSHRLSNEGSFAYCRSSRSVDVLFIFLSLYFFASRSGSFLDFLPSSDLDHPNVDSLYITVFVVVFLLMSSLLYRLWGVPLYCFIIPPPPPPISPESADWSWQMLRRHFVVTHHHSMGSALIEAYWPPNGMRRRKQVSFYFVLHCFWCRTVVRSSPTVDTNYFLPKIAQIRSKIYSLVFTLRRVAALTGPRVWRICVMRP